MSFRLLKKLPILIRIAKTCYRPIVKNTSDSGQADLRNILNRQIEQVQVLFNEQLKNFNCERHLEKIEELISRLHDEFDNKEFVKPEEVKNIDSLDKYYENIKILLQNLAVNTDELGVNTIETIEKMKMPIYEQWKSQNIANYVPNMEDLKKVLQNIEEHKNDLYDAIKYADLQMSGNDLKLKAAEAIGTINATINRHLEYYDFQKYADTMDNFKDKLYTTLEHIDTTDPHKLKSNIIEAVSEHWKNINTEEYLEKMNILTITLFNALQSIQINGISEYKTVETLKKFKNLIETGELDLVHILAIGSLCQDELTKELFAEVFLLYCLNEPTIIGMRLVAYLLKYGYCMYNTTTE